MNKRLICKSVGLERYFGVSNLLPDQLTAETKMKAKGKKIKGKDAFFSSSSPGNNIPAVFLTGLQKSNGHCLLFK